jgi:hypothetical protein
MILHERCNDMLPEPRDHDVPKPILEEWLVHDDGSARGAGDTPLEDTAILDEERMFYALARGMV